MFITETRSGENPILDENSLEPLVFKNLDGDIAHIIKNDVPWTHEMLMQLDLHSILGPGYSIIGFEAFIGDRWVGSTEI